MLICEVLDRETVVASAVGHIPNGAPLTRLLHVEMRVRGQNYGIGEKSHISRKTRQKIHELLRENAFAVTGYIEIEISSLDTYNPQLFWGGPRHIL